MERILVAGGAGYIGSHACKLLAQHGYEPVTYDNLSTGHAEFVKWGPLVEGELHDTDRLTQAIRDHRPSAVFHLAASAYVGESILNPMKYYENNVGGTLSLLRAMRRGGVDSIVFSSTCATYGEPDTPLISESCPQQPINPYGHSKLMIERILTDLAGRQEINFVALRFFNAAGADRDGEIGEWHEPETHLIPLAIHSAIGGPPLSILGTDFPTPDGTAVRDYIHVEDIGRAHILAMNHLADTGSSDCINLGAGQGYSVRDLVNTLRDMQAPVKAHDAPRRDGDPAYLVADPARALERLGWKTSHDIRSILETALAWHREHGV